MNTTSVAGFSIKSKHHNVQILPLKPMSDPGPLSRFVNYTLQRKKYIFAALVIYIIVMSGIYDVMRQFSFIDASENVRKLSGFLNNFHLPSSLGGSSEEIFDVHLEDSVLGHTGETVSHFGEAGNWTREKLVAIGLGITSKGVQNPTASDVATKFQLFHTFLPSFCATATAGYHYAFYLAYDHTDRYFVDPNFLVAFQKAFRSTTTTKCPKEVKTSIHMVQCDHAGRPTWAQNDAMLEAYLDNVEYYYRINDDTHLETKDWTASFVQTLSQYDPPYLGVVGPTHSGGNTGILTYDFVHRTHLDILGYYYPRLFSDWWGDDWVTGVYMPSRSKKLAEVRLAHTLVLGQRYGVNWAVGNKLQGQLVIDKETISRYVDYVRAPKPPKPDGSKVISMSLYGRDPRYAWGAIRNAQLAPIYFPAWRLRFYIADLELSNHASAGNWTVPPRILRKLIHLGAEVVYAKKTNGDVPPHLWRYLVVDDSRVEYFLVRDADARFSDREVSAVKSWLEGTSAEAKDSAAHCIRDHQKHIGRGFVDGLWGGRAALVRRALKNEPMSSVLEKYYAKEKNLVVSNGDKNVTRSVLVEVLWPLLAEKSYCFDSVTCPAPARTYSSQAPRKRMEYMGQEYDEHQEVMSKDQNQGANVTCGAAGNKQVVSVNLNAISATAGVQITTAKLTTAKPTTAKSK